jgi:hypothetical protein
MLASTSSPLPWTIINYAWRHLPLLVAIDVLLVLAAVPAAVMLVTGHAVLAPLVAALFVGPIWAGTIATTDRLFNHNETTLRMLLLNIGQHAWTGITVSFAPAAIVAMTIGTLGLLVETRGQAWLLPSLFVDGCAITLVVLAQPSLFSLATGRRLRGLALWKTALALAVAQPRTILSFPTLAVLVWLSISLSGGPGLLLFFPALVALAFSAVTAAATDRLPPPTVPLVIPVS